MDSGSEQQPPGPVISRKTRKLLSKRVVLSAIGFATATVALWAGKLSGEEWVYTFSICLMGHHSEDLIKAWRRQ